MMKLDHDTYPLLRLLQPGGLICLLLALAMPAQAGDPFSFSGNWNYRETGGDIETSSQFSHSYTLNYSKELSQFMTLSSSLRYNENLPTEGAATDSTSPSISLDTRNDLFFLGLNATQTKFNRENSPSRTDQSWGGTLFTLQEEWPALRLFFNQGKNYDDRSPRRNDTESTTYGGGIDYELADFTMLYDYRYGEFDDNVDGSSSENTEHMAQLKYSRRFFDDRLGLTASQQYRKNRTTSKIPTSIGGDFLLPVAILSAASGADDTPANGVLANNPDLIDGDIVTPAGVNITSSLIKQNIAAEVNFQPVDRFKVLLDQELSLALQGLLSWEVWVSNDGVSWTQVPNIPAVYQLENNQTEVVIDLIDLTNSRYVKAVSDISIISAISVFVTEIEVGEIRTSSASRVSIRTEVISHQTEVGLGYRISAKWQTSYNFRRAKTEQNRGADTERINHSFNISYFPTARLSFSLGIGESSDKADGAEDRTTRTFAASMNAELLRTLNLSLGYTRTETDDGIGRDTSSDTVNVIFNAIIYPDLTASLTNSWTRSQNQNGSETTTMGVNLNTSANLTPKLDVNFNGTYVDSSTEGLRDESDFDDNSTRYGVNANYRPSDILQLSGTFNRNEDTNQNTLAGNATLLPSRKLQALFGFVYEFGDEERELYNSTLSWLMTQQLSWQTTGSYISSAGGDSWAVSSTVNANF